MGPPKKRPQKPSIATIRHNQNCFEHRWNDESQSYYMYNPWTGETIFDLKALNRHHSMWCDTEQFPSEQAEHTDLYPEFYQSRRWGRRRFQPYNGNREAAALHMTAVARGFIARNRLRKIYRERYHTVRCKYTFYYYFVDNWYPERETSWYKPRLAMIGDILMKKEEDPEDYLKGKKYSKIDFARGPFIRVQGVKKSEKGKAPQAVAAFHAVNPWRELCVSKYEEIDFEDADIGTIVAWMEGTKQTALELTAYHLMRTAAAEKDSWARIVSLMKKYPDNMEIQLAGYHSFSKLTVPLDSTGLLGFSAFDAMELCLEIIIDKKNCHGQLIKVFAMSGFQNILSIRPGRLEFISTACVPEQGEYRHAAVTAYYNIRLSIFNRYLTKIPNETVQLFTKNSTDIIEVIRPLPRSIDVVYWSMKCLCLIAQEMETKEQLAFLLVRPVFFALDICQEEASIMLYGLQLLYNLCYRCEAGQEAILTTIPQAQFFATVHHNHSGDPDVMHQSRRLELALKHNGWRGSIEVLITREMKGEVLEAQYLRQSEFGHAAAEKKENGGKEGGGGDGDAKKALENK